ncbi:NAD-dependent epimerase/dehydratase family protein [Dokdonella sp.]|uniref:SDR family oxidoreductase n=1 Tax=Dokdonella sp. TaxID=2291710 RepID=UPI001AFF0036|nr:NAD-dependent epimerase/dehydratase family protein [Dokdonella sp.]MBO9662125.1 NAD-dependent epimerase/dehydratase family protein [Dokdonella sp.]
MRALVVGASGAVGRFLLPRLLDAGHDVVALSRGERAGRHARLRWIVGDLDRDVPLPQPVEAIFSLGPLDAFARWFARTAPEGRPHLVALGSMSIDSKRDSIDAAERAVVERLRAAELELADAATRRGCAWTVLRPTLIYGAGIDRSLTPIARFARRWRVFPRLPGARGLRQPVHADDLAAACIAVLERPVSAGKTYALGGGERLGFDAMLERVRASLPVRCLPLPLPIAAARTLARLGLVPAAAVERLTRDLVAADDDARTDFGWSPRGFVVDANTWRAGGEA